MPSLPDQTRALHRALSELTRASRFRDRDAVCCHGVTPTQSHALDRLATLGSLSLGELAAALNLEKSSASRLVDGLVGGGWVRRAADPQDARARRISLTAKGRRVAAAVEADLLAERGAFLRSVAPAERATFIRLLFRLADFASEQHRAAPDSGCSGAPASRPAPRSRKTKT